MLIYYHKLKKFECRRQFKEFYNKNNKFTIIYKLNKKGKRKQVLNFIVVLPDSDISLCPFSFNYFEIVTIIRVFVD